MLQQVAPPVALLQENLDANENISTVHFLSAYGTICEFLNLLGMVFQFVTRDVSDKMNILQTHLDQHGESHATLQGAVMHEVKAGTTNVKGPPKSASRTLLRLNRALGFISEFLHQVLDSDESAAPSHLAGNAYDKTLSKHHAFMVRQSVRVALYAMPSRPDLLHKLVGSDALNEADHASLSSVVATLQGVHDTLDALFTKQSLNSLK
eukprot:m.72743 g.72743  ORF g.72743 m.72743 type:complete len:208 (-) comp14271_c0_seq1:328-951(-)